MGRIFGILLIVLGVWIGAELYTNGVEGAFGGVFAGEAEDVAAETLSTPKRAGEAVKRAYGEEEDRIDRALDEASQ